MKLYSECRDEGWVKMVDWAHTLNSSHYLEISANKYLLKREYFSATEIKKNVINVFVYLKI
jgi:hypothetical protein